MLTKREHGTQWILIAGCVVALLVGTGAAMSPARAQDDPKPADSKQNDKSAVSPSLDDALIKDLDNELLEGAGDLKNRPQPKADAKDRKPGEADAQVIDTDMPAEDADPLVHISQQMRSAEELIPRATERPLAQQLQQKIVDELAHLIDQAESQQAQQSSSSSQKNRKQKSVTDRQMVKQPKQPGGQAGKPGKASNNPAEDSSNRLGQADAARPDPEMLKGLMKDSWGHLPPRAREQMLQNTPDKFLPQYELLIERYYKRLAEDAGPR